jgi:hypothetical protein
METELREECDSRDRKRVLSLEPGHGRKQFEAVLKNNEHAPSRNGPPDVLRLMPTDSWTICWYKLLDVAHPPAFKT